VIIANTFAASRVGLEPAGLGSSVAAANAAAVRAALAAREAAADGPVAVAGPASSVGPAAMQAPEGGSPPGRPAGGDPRFPGRADVGGQAHLRAGAGAGPIAPEMTGAQGYGGAAVHAAAQTGPPAGRA